MFDRLYFGFPLLESIVGGGFLPTLIICLIICPGVPYLLGAVIDGYWVPWNPRYQFFAFLPGNIFLAFFIASTSSTFQQEGFRINPFVNVGVFVGALAFYFALQKLDRTSHYTPGQLKSAMKRYHNGLYFWYGYLAVVCFIAMFSTSAPLSQKLIASAFGAVWLACMVADNFVSGEIKALRFEYAHVESRPIWLNGWKIRRLTVKGYAYA